MTIDTTEAGISEPTQMKYLFIEINERNGEKEYIFRCLAQCSIEQDNDLIADGIALNWYEDSLDEYPFNRDSFWFEGSSIAVEVGNVQEIPQEHYQLLKLYLSDLTPPDDAIAEAIATGCFLLNR